MQARENKKVRLGKILIFLWLFALAQGAQAVAAPRENALRYDELVSGSLQEYWDQDSQLLYLRARWYDPRIGRFISADPYEGKQSDPRSLNRYSYAHSDPVHNGDPSGAMSLGEVSITTAIVGAMTNVAVGYAFSQGDYTLREAAKDFGIGAVTAPVGGVAAKLLVPMFKSAIGPALQFIGAADRITLYGANGWQRLAVKTSRFFVNTNRTYPSVRSTFIGRLLIQAFPGAGWEMHHVFVQQAWTRAGSAAQIYSNAVANEGLRRLANGGWNLLPIPRAFNNWLGKSPLATQVFSTAIYSALVFGPAEFAEHLMNDDE